MAKMVDDLQQLKGVGQVLARRLKDAGFDSFAKIAQAGEEGLNKVGGISPRFSGSIVQQARVLTEPAQPSRAARAETVKQRLVEVRGQLQALAEDSRERFRDRLSGKPGKKLASDLVRIEDALQRLGDSKGRQGGKRAGKALAKAEKRVSGLEGASLKKLHKGLKKARKAVLKVL